MAAIAASVAAGVVAIGACVYLVVWRRRARGKPGEEELRQRAATGSLGHGHHRPGDTAGQAPNAAVTAATVTNPVYHARGDPGKAGPRPSYAAAAQAVDAAEPAAADGTTSVPGSRPGGVDAGGGVPYGRNDLHGGGLFDAFPNQDNGHEYVAMGIGGGGSGDHSSAKRGASSSACRIYSEARAANDTGAAEYVNVPGRSNADGRHMRPVYTEPAFDAKDSHDMYALIPEQQGSRARTAGSTSSTDSAGRRVLLLNSSIPPTVVFSSVADAESTSSGTGTNTGPVAVAEFTVQPPTHSRPVAAAVVAVQESAYGFSTASSAAEDATYATAGPFAKASALEEEPCQYETMPLPMLAQSNRPTASHYDLLPEQMSSTPPLDVAVTLATGPALFAHELDRAGAEAALTAAAAADSTCVRWLVRPKGADTVLSLLVPSKHTFFHEHIIAQPDGTYVCNAAQGKPEATMLALCGRITEALRSSFSAVSVAPVLRGIDRGDAEEVSTV